MFSFSKTYCIFRFGVLLGVQALPLTMLMESRLFNIYCIPFLDVFPRTFISVLRPPERRVECGGHGD